LPGPKTLQKNGIIDKDGNPAPWCGGNVFSGGHNLQADVPPANIVALFGTAYEVGKYPLAHYD
jgi:hypothetical protein